MLSAPQTIPHAQTVVGNRNFLNIAWHAQSSSNGTPSHQAFAAWSMVALLIAGQMALWGFGRCVSASDWCRRHPKAVYEHQMQEAAGLFRSR